MEKRNDKINKMAILEASRFNAKVKNWRNSEDGKKIAKYNAMTSDEYMTEVRKVIPTALCEEDWHKQQETMFWLQFTDFMNAFRQEGEYQLAFWTELCRILKPNEYKRIKETFDEVKRNEDAQIADDTAKAEKDKKGEEDMNKISPLTKREKTTFMATNHAAFSNIFSVFRGMTEIMQAVYGDQIEKMREAERFAVKEDKPKAKTAK